MLNQLVQKNGQRLRAAYYHAGMPPEQREQVQQQWLQDHIQVRRPSGAFRFARLVLSVHTGGRMPLWLWGGSSISPYLARANSGSLTRHTAAAAGAVANHEAMLRLSARQSPLAWALTSPTSGSSSTSPSPSRSRATSRWEQGRARPSLGVFFCVCP